MNLEHLKNKKRKTNNRLLAALPWCNLQKNFYKKQIFTRLNIFYELKHFLVIESVLKFNSYLDITALPGIHKR